MNLRRPPRWLVILLSVGLVAALLGWWWSEWVWANKLRLADGRELQVRAVTYGTNHVFVDGPLWVRLARHHLSTTRATRLGLRLYQRASPLPSCMVWTQWRGTNTPARFASVMNRQGLESEPIDCVVLAPVPGRPDTIVAWQWENFPRRQPRMILRLYDRDAAYRPLLAGQMPVRNPASPGRRFDAPPPPVRATNDGVEFSLLSMRLPESPSQRPPWTFVVRPATAVFSVVEQGQPSALWTLRSLVARGDSGNRFAVFQPGIERSFQQMSVTLPEVLWPDEPSWNIIAEFSRTRDQGADASITVTAPASPSNPPFTTNLNAEAQGVIIQSVDLRGTSHIWRYKRGSYFPTSDLTVLYTAAVQRAQIYLARARDDQGRDLRFGDDAHPWKGKYTAALEIPRDSRTVDLTLAIHRSRFIEFRFRPEHSGKAESGKRKAEQDR